MRGTVAFACLAFLVTLAACDGPSATEPDGPASIRVTVLLAGSPVEGNLVILRTLTDEDVGRRHTDPRGETVFADLEAGSYRVLANFPTIWLPVEGSPPERVLELEEGEEAALSFRFRTAF